VSTATSLDPRTLRSAFGSFTTGVTIVTTRSEEAGDVGLTANSFSSVSLDPPMVLWSLSRTSSSLSAFEAAEHFAVHVLSAEQEPLSGRFATKGIDKFAGLSLGRGPEAIPLLEGCAARFACRTVHRYEGGDHIIFVGEVLDFTHGESKPLAFHGGQYATLLRRKVAATHCDQDGTSLTSDNVLFHISRLFFDLRGDAVAERRRRNWNEAEYGVLNSLGREDGQSLAELEPEARRRGRELASGTLLSLQEKGLIEVEGAPGPAMRARLTERGRDGVVAIIGMLKAAESDALSSLDDGEAHVLRALLSRASARPLGNNEGRNR
jgi:3-hydroxy-9,10-secoandrosta-1,3,5(10)-triene-9,17-dione monooxygenase reductase component